MITTLVAAVLGIAAGIVLLVALLLVWGVVAAKRDNSTKGRDE